MQWPPEYQLENMAVRAALEESMNFKSCSDFHLQAERASDEFHCHEIGENTPIASIHQHFLQRDPKKAASSNQLKNHIQSKIPESANGTNLRGQRVVAQLETYFFLLKQLLLCSLDIVIKCLPCKQEAFVPVKTPLEGG